MHGVEVIKVVKTLEIGGRCEDEPEMFHAMYQYWTEGGDLLFTKLDRIKFNPKVNGRLPTTDREGKRVDERQKPRKYTGFGDDPLLDPNYDWNSSLKDKGR